MSKPLQIVCPHCDTVNRLPAARLADGPTCGRCKKPLFVAQPAVLTAENFDRHVTGSDIAVLVDFWAPWCGPCRAMAPAFQRAAARLEPAMRLAKLDTEQAPAIAARYDIRSIPTLAIFRHGRIIARQAGAMDQASIERWAHAADSSTGR